MPGSFAKTLKGLEILDSFKDVMTITNTVVTSESYRFLPDIVERLALAKGEFGALYRYVGPLDAGQNYATIDLVHADMTVSINWQKISGKSNGIYEYMGGTPVATPLSLQDYTDLSLWKEVPATSTQLTDFNIATTSAVAATAMFVVNDVVGGASATITNSAVTATSGDISIKAIENASIVATADSSAHANGGSSVTARASLWRCPVRSQRTEYRRRHSQP